MPPIAKTIFIVLLLIELAQCRSSPKKGRCTDNTGDGLTWKALCARVHNRECLDRLTGPVCVCENGYQEEKGTCRPQKCNEIVREFRDFNVTWQDFCQIYPHHECSDEENRSPRCVCKDGFKKDPYGFESCIAEKCDQIRSGYITTTSKICEMQNLQCLDRDDTGPICVVHTCNELKPGTSQTYNDFCSRQKNRVCLERHENYPDCVCRQGFKDIMGVCTAMACSDTAVDMLNLTWSDLCIGLLGPGRECVTLGQDGPNCRCTNKFNNGKNNSCIPKTCNDNRTGLEKWKTYCEKYTNEECKDHILEGPECVCKIGYNMISEVCKVQSCSDIKRGTFMTWNEICKEKDNQICVQTGNKIPTCECVKGFHEVSNGSCILLQCADHMPGQTVPFEHRCLPQKCANSPRGPICVPITCHDEVQPGMSYDVMCANKTYMVCEENENGVPQCKCKNGFKRPPGVTDSYKCVAQDCTEYHASGVTWNAYCGKDPTRQCSVSSNTGPQCICKPGFKDGQSNHCDQIFCSNVTFPSNSSVEQECVSVKAGERCVVSCNHGFDADPVTLECDIKGNWKTNVTRCKKIESETLCPELFAPGNGTMSGICRNSRPNSICTFDCNPGFEMMFNGAQIPNLVCFKSGDWSLQTPYCKDKCEIEESIRMCQQDNAECRNDNNGEDIRCECQSPYLTWKRGGGCQFEQYAYIATLGGFKMPPEITQQAEQTSRKLQADAGGSGSEVDEYPTNLHLLIYTLEMFRGYLDFKENRLLNFSRQAGTNYWKLEIIAFYRRPQPLLEIIVRNSLSLCQKFDKDGDCELGVGFGWNLQELGKAEVKEAPPACSSGYFTCPEGSKCVQDPYNPLVFTCECESNYRTVYLAYRENPNSFKAIECVLNAKQVNVLEQVKNDATVIGVVLGVLLALALIVIGGLAYRLYKK